MTLPDPIRVLLVDDSPFVRRAFQRVLRQAAGVRVVGEAGDGSEALTACRTLHPDVVLLDVTMPVLDGLEVLRRLRDQAPDIAVVVVSGATQPGAEATLAALELGAFDFVDKTSVSTMRLHELAAELLSKIRGAAAARRPATDIKPFVAPHPVEQPAVLVIGASTGGPPALLALLEALSPGFPAPILVVQHISDAFVAALVNRLSQRTRMPVEFAEPGSPLSAGRVSFFRGGANAELVNRSGALSFERAPAPAGTPHVPSVDALFLSAARVCGPRAWGVLLTGMGRDGAEGMLAIRRAGGFTLAQDQATSVVWGMPRAAFENGGASVVLPLHAMAGALERAVDRPDPAVVTGAPRHSKEEVCVRTH